MGENKIKVSASTTSKAVRVNVNTPSLQGAVTLSPDTSAYNANIAEQWAISENIVLGKDYSSKYYAGIAKESAENAQNIEEIVKNDYNTFLEASITANSELQATKDNAITEIESNKINAVDSMNTVKNDAVDSINSTKTTILNDIEFVAEGEKKEIEDLIDNGKDELRESIGDVKVLTTLEIGDIGFTQMAIDETKGKRRVLNGQLIIQDQYVELTNIIKASVALNPDLACTESEWQTSVTMSINGVCEKFVIDDDAGTIRLPKYPQYLDLTNNTGAKSQTVSVYGNGNSLGLTNGGTTLYNISNNPNPGYMYPCNNGNFQTTLGSSAAAVNAQSPATFGITKNASKSGLTGKVTVPAVQSEKIKGTYFIQVATGAETEDNIINEIELNNPFSLLDYKYSEYELNNLSWLRSNGQYNSKAVYPAVYDLLLRIYNKTETKTGVSVKLTTETFTDYDFVLNTSNETFRLPIKVKANYFEGVAPVVGNGMALGLNNGTQNFSISSTSGYTVGQTVSGYNVPIGTTITTSTLTNDKVVGITTDPTKSGIESQLTIVDLYLYFYVGETVQNANLINAGRIEETVSQIKASVEQVQLNKLDKSAVKAYITQTYVKGTSWYRIWSDKWCEQGGLASSGNSVSVSLLKKYRDTNYSAYSTLIGTPGGYPYAWRIENITTSGFNIGSDQGSANSQKQWLTCGYLA